MLPVNGILCTPLADLLLFPLLLLGHDVLWPPTYGFACFHDRCSVLVCPPQTPDRYPSAHPGSRRDLVSAVTYAAFCSGFSAGRVEPGHPGTCGAGCARQSDRKSTRLNSSHVRISY